MKLEQENAFLRRQNDLLSDRKQHMEHLYEDAVKQKETYRSELIQSRKGFGKIYDVVQRLSVFEPGEIFLQAIPVIEDMLENKGVASYTVDEKYQNFARLQVCSSGIRGRVPASIELAKYPDVVSALDASDLWANRSLAEDLPDYIACIKDRGSLRVLITLRDVTFDQMNVYYMNEIRVLVRLMGNFLMKALEYQKANSVSNYIGTTMIMRADRFNEQLSYVRSMAASKLASYRLLRIYTHGETVQHLNDLLQGFVRSSDFLGYGADGNLYLLAMQVDSSTEHFLLDRFLSKGWECEFVKDETMEI